MAIGGIVAGALVLVGSVAKYSLSKGNAGALRSADFQLLVDATKEQTGILREIKEGMIIQAAEQRQQSQALTRIESSQSALHRRLDGITGPRP